MSEDDASTSQQTPHNTNSDNLKSTKFSKEERKYVKCKWFKKSEIKSLTHAAIKEQIGNCTLCQSLPSSDCVQLPKCLCYFCRECFNTYLDKFATPKPVLKKSYLSLNPVDYGRGKKPFREFVKKNSKVFGGVFDASSLSFDGNVLPKQPKPRIITQVSDFEERRRIRKSPIKTNLYHLVKLEVFDCPNCFAFYDDINRTNVQRFRVVGDILELMNKK